MKLYLDENIPPVLAQQLRRRGFDILSAHEVEMLGKSDEEQLKYASEHGRVLLTFDTGLILLAVRWLADGRHHSGVLLSKELRIEQIGELVRLCSRFLTRGQPENMADVILYLQHFKKDI